MPSFLTDRIRKSLPPSARRRLRRLADQLFPWIGSINGSRAASNEVGITFDDGPDLAVTPGLLTLLRQRGVRATFFVLTDKATAHPDLVGRMVAEGHEVALHFDRHDRLTDMPLPVARERLIAARAQLEKLVGPVRFFRPPFGGQSLATYRLARSLGLQVVTWGPTAEDWVEQLPAAAAARALSTMEAGDILLLHDGLEVPEGDPVPRFDRVRMVELILDGMEKMRLAPTTVGALVASGKPRLSPWFRY